MPGGGPSPAETTLPLALKWPAPPPARTGRALPPAARPRAHRPAGAGCPGRPATRAAEPDPAARLPARPPGAPRPPGPPGGGPGGPGAGPRPPGSPGSTATQRSSLVRSGAGMAIGTLVSRGHRLPAHPRPGLRDRHRGARQRVQQRQHAAEHRLLPDARRHLHQRGGPAAGPGGQARPGPRRGLRPADVHPGRAGLARQSPWWRRSWPLRWWTCTRPPSTAPSTT